MEKETDTMFDAPVLGSLNYREWHASVEGFHAGARWGTRQHEYSQEKHYWRIGYLAGTATRYGLLAVAYKKFKELHD